MRKPLFLVLVFLLFLLPPAPLLASPWYTFGTGSRDIAMGRATSSLANDGSAAWLNPAALSLAEDFIVKLGWQYADLTLKYDGGDSHTDPFHGINFSLAVPAGRLAVGFMIHFPDQHLGTAHMPPHFLPKYTLFSNWWHIMQMAMGYSFKITDWLAIGSGGYGMAKLDGAINIPIEFVSTEVPSPQASASTKMNMPLEMVMCAGFLLTPTDRLRIGGGWRDEFMMLMAIDINLNMNIVDLPFIQLGGPAAMGMMAETFYTPETAYAAISYDFTDRLTLAFQVDWIEYSDFPNPTSGMSVDMPESLSSMFSIPPHYIEVGPDFKDRFIPRFGAEWLASSSPHLDLTLRGGYTYERTPVPDKFAYLYVDTDHHVFSFGSDFTLKDVLAALEEPFSFDFHVQYFYLPEREIEPHEISNLIGDFTAHGEAINVGFDLTFRW